MLTPAASAISASPGTFCPPDLRVRHTLQDAGKVLQDRRSAPVGYAPERTERDPGHRLVDALG